MTKELHRTGGMYGFSVGVLLDIYPRLKSFQLENGKIQAIQVKKYLKSSSDKLKLSNKQDIKGNGQEWAP